MLIFSLIPWIPFRGSGHVFIPNPLPSTFAIMKVFKINPVALSGPSRLAERREMVVFQK